MSFTFLSSHPDFTSPPPLGPLTLHPSLNGSFSNNPIEQFHFRTIQRIVKEHPEFTETYQPPVPSFEPTHALKYNLRTTPNHPPSKMSGKQTMNWNGKSAPHCLQTKCTDLQVPASALGHAPPPYLAKSASTSPSLLSMALTITLTGDADAKLLIAILKVSDVKPDFEAVAGQASAPVNFIIPRSQA